VCACEADCNGALTMQILKLISGGKPALLVDTTVVPPGESNLILCQNCGGAATCFATASGDPVDSLKRVRIVPNHTGKAVGPAISYLAEPQECVTWARLSRRSGKYRMHVIKAKLGGIDEQMAAMLSRWPTALLSIDTPDVFEFLESYNSMHLHLVTGDYVDELVEFCKLLEIECIRL
jgi:L-fucose isomerase